MIKIELDVPNNVFKVEVAGSPADMFADTLMAFNGIYDAIRQDNPIGAEIYKREVIDKISLAFIGDEEVEESPLDALISAILKQAEVEDILKPRTDEEIIKEILEGGIDENE